MAINIFNFFRRQKPKEPPTPFETMAAFNRFRNVHECSPDFYRKHQSAIDMTVGFVGFLAQQDGRLAQVLQVTMAPLPDTAAVLEITLRNINLEQRTLDFIDATMTTIMETLLPVVKAPDLPEYLKDCVWPIVGAFEP